MYIPREENMGIKKFFIDMWSDVKKGQNIDVYGLILVAFVSSILSFFSVLEIPIINGVILAAISALLVSAIVSKHNISSLQTDSENIIKSIQIKKACSNDFFFSRKATGNLSKRIDGVKTLDLLGLSLNIFSLQHKTELIDLKKSGAKIRLIISNPKNESLQELINQRCLETSDTSTHKQLAQLSLENFQSIIGTEPNGGSIELRLTNIPPHISYMGLDADSEKGEIQIELYLDQNSVQENPLFILKRDIDTKWYSAFQKQFTYLWENAEPVKKTEQIV
jgi:hypothetical protein